MSADNRPPVIRMPEYQPLPTEWITRGSLPRAAWRLVLPLMGNMALFNLFAVVDMVFIGRLGSTAIAGVAISSTIMGLLFTLAIGLTTGSSALVAQAFGGRDRPRAERIAAQSMFLAIMLSIIVGAAGLPLTDRLLAALGARADVISVGRSYLQVRMGGSVTMFLYFAFAAALRGAGDTVTPLKIMGLANVLNIILDPILIFGWFGMPRLEVAGSAWATLICQGVGAGLLSRSFFGRQGLHFNLRLRDILPHLRIIADLFRIAVFSSGQMLVRNISGLVIIRIVALFGEIPLAGFGITMRLWLIAMLPGMAFGDASSTLVGQNIGAANMDRARKAGWITTRMYFVVSLGITLLFYLFAPQLIALFNSRPDIVASGSECLRWISMSFGFLAFSLVLGKSMNGAGDTFWPMMITAVALLAVRIPVSYILAASMNRAVGIWAGILISGAVQALLFIIAYRWGRWQTIGARLLNQNNSSQ